MKTIETLNPPQGPTEAEIREHFGSLLPEDARLMQPEYTSIWALEDGTLLWDRKNGYVDLAPYNSTGIPLSLQEDLFDRNELSIKRSQAKKAINSFSAEELDLFFEYEKIRLSDGFIKITTKLRR